VFRQDFYQNITKKSNDTYLSADEVLRMHKIKDLIPSFNFIFLISG